MNDPMLPSVTAGLVSTVRRSARLIIPALGALFYACTDAPTEPNVDPPLYAIFETTFVVNTSDDVVDGSCDATHCSLREAINAANANPGMDAIHFDIAPSGPHTIETTERFPAVYEVFIDGTTQPGFSGSPVIELDGSATPSEPWPHHAITIGARGNATVKGLKITGFSGHAIAFSFSGSNNTVQGNHLLNNQKDGIFIRGPGGPGNNLIGGTLPSERNVISGNGANGINFEISAQFYRVQGNYIGTDPTGTSALPNGAHGIYFRADLARDEGNNIIGGPEPGAGNVISGNTGYGIAFDGNEASVGRNVIEGNLIGTAADGVSPLGNGLSGVFVRFAIDDTQILRNTIAFNSHHGALLAGSSTAFPTRALIRENSIHSNALLGIELSPPASGVNVNDSGDGDTGANNGQNYPVLTSATTSGTGSVSISGDLNSTASTDFTLELFANQVADESGHGEGETFLGSVAVTTDITGNATFSVTFPATVPVGQFITATATDPDSNTSEFSAVLEVVEDPNEAPVVNSVTLPSDPVAVNVSTAITADFSDANLGDLHTATINWDDGHVTAGGVTEDGGSGTVAASHVYATAGVYTITVTVTEDMDPALSGSRSSTEEATNSFLVVYDPSGGFVTGGGWINSREVAYKPDLSLTGKANFGFVSKYKKGATVPTGNTEFRFKAGDLNFHSNSYDWLVVTGSDHARFKGEGTVNGMGCGAEPYKFHVWAGDGDPDTFRIRIWCEDEGTGEETDLYDNGFDQPIGGGSIVIHTEGN